MIQVRGSLAFLFSVILHLLITRQPQPSISDISAQYALHYHQFPMSFQSNSSINTFVPGYQTRSDFLPGSKVVQVSEQQRVQMLRDIEMDRQKGSVLNTPPPGFNPSRYQSFQVYESVNTNQRIPGTQMVNVGQPNINSNVTQPKYYD